MFNEEIKRYVFDYRDSFNGQPLIPEKSLNLLFQKSEKLESELGKDLAQFTFPELDKFFLSLKSGSVYYISYFWYMVSVYTQFCMNKHLVSQEYNYCANIPEIKLEVYIIKRNSDYIESGIVTYENLLTMLNELLNPCDKFLILSLFEGVKGSEYCELIELKESNFSFNNGEWTVSLSNGREYPVNEKYVKIAVESARTHCYYSFNPQKRHIIELNFLETEYIFKNRANTFSSNQYSRISKRLRKICSDLEVSGLTVSMLRYSGICHYIRREAEKNGIAPLELCDTSIIMGLLKRYEIEGLKPCQLKKKIEQYF